MADNTITHGKITKAMAATGAMPNGANASNHRLECKSSTPDARAKQNPRGEATERIVVKMSGRLYYLRNEDRLSADQAEELKQLVERTKGDAFSSEDVTRVLADFEGAWRSRVQSGLSSLGLELAALVNEEVIDVRFVSGVVCRSEH